MGTWTPITLGDMMDKMSIQFSQREAIISESRRISYKELNDETERIAKAFLAIGIEKGDKVSVWLRNCPEWIYIQLALGMIGAVLVPINTRFRVKELEYTLSQSDSKLLVTMDRFLNIDFAELVCEAIPELRKEYQEECSLDRFPNLKKVICVGTSQISAMTPWEVFLSKGIGVPKKALLQRKKDIKPDDVVMFQYTSGTTSFPKGVMLTHNGIIRNSFHMGQRMTIETTDRLFCPLPFFHVGGAVVSTLVALQNGASLVISDSYEPETALKIVEKEGCTAMTGIETHYLMMYEHIDFDKYDLSCLEKGWVVGPPQIIRAVYEKLGMSKVLNIYGISEASPNVTTTNVEDPLEFRMHWHGKPHQETEIKIVDYKTGKLRLPHQEGEICVRGWNVMKGYYKKPEETRAVIDGEGWLHTGDSGLMDDNGNLRYTGRIKDIIRVGGENVSAMEVENYILSHPKVKNVAVIAVDDKRLTEVCLAFVQLKENEIATEEEIIDYCKGRIANFKVPRYIQFVHEFPMTGSGKIQKAILKDKFRVNS